ncbi:MAG: hypothetical protein ABSD59_22110 [Terracidiphilus sp.]|jgi:hypothetical protein
MPSAGLNFFAGRREEFLIGPVNELNFSFGAGDPHQRWAAIRHGAEALFAFAQKLFRALALGDVDVFNNGSG